jgi:hypothetical protein
LWQPLELFKKDDVLVGWDLETLSAALARDVRVDPDEVILNFLKHRARPGIRTWRQL